MSRHLSDQLIKRASERMAAGQYPAAIDYLRQSLTLDPHHAAAHAILAMALTQSKRLHAADYESQLALQLAPEDSLSHYARSEVLVARRQLQAALQHSDQAIALDPTDASNHTQRGAILVLLHRAQEARAAYDHALQLEPDSLSTISALGYWCLRYGTLQEARDFAQNALELDAEHHDSLLLMARVLLKMGNTEGAREHVHWALRNNPSSQNALEVLCQIKARRNWFLGFWWRFNNFIGSSSPTRAITILLLMYVAYRYTVLISRDLGRPDVGNIITIAWLIFAIYTWVAPFLFRRMLKRELQQVQLRSDF